MVWNGGCLGMMRSIATLKVLYVYRPARFGNHGPSLAIAQALPRLQWGHAKAVDGPNYRLPCAVGGAWMVLPRGGKEGAIWEWPRARECAWAAFLCLCLCMEKPRCEGFILSDTAEVPEVKHVRVPRGIMYPRRVPRRFGIGPEERANADEERQSVGTFREFRDNREGSVNSG